MDIISKLKDFVDLDGKTHFAGLKAQITGDEKAFIENPHSSPNDELFERFGAGTSGIFMGGKYRSAALMAMTPDERATYIAGRSTKSAIMWKSAKLTAGMAAGIVVMPPVAAVVATLGGSGYVGHKIGMLHGDMLEAGYYEVNGRMKSLIEDMKRNGIDPEKVMQGVLAKQNETRELAGSQPDGTNLDYLRNDQRLMQATGLDIEALKIDVKPTQNAGKADMPNLARQRDQKKGQAPKPPQKEE